MDKFDWLATESAPKNFAMKIVSGDFIFPNGRSLYVPDGKRIHKGWGNGVSTHIVGEDFKPLPNRLDITFFSYTEDVFYQGSFELPYDKILSLFEAGHYSIKDKAQGNYTKIMAGVAPGGVVAVWLYGPDKITEVFYGKAEKANIPWTRINKNPSITRDDYIRLVQEDTINSEALEALKRDGIPYGLWDTYRPRYLWQPVFSASRPPKIIHEINYYNGEKDYLYYPLDRSIAAERRAIPREMIFFWISPKGKPLKLKIYFNESEIFDAFYQLAAAESTQLDLEFDLHRLEQRKNVSVYLRNNNEAVHLKNTKIDIYKTHLSVERIENM